MCCCCQMQQQKQRVSSLPTGYNELSSLCRHQQNSAFGVVPLASDIPCEKSFAGYTKISTQSWISTNHKRILVITWKSRLPGSLCCSKRDSHCTHMKIISQQLHSTREPTQSEITQITNANAEVHLDNLFSHHERLPLKDRVLNQ